MRRFLLLLTLCLASSLWSNAKPIDAGHQPIRYGKKIDANGRLTHNRDTVIFTGIVQSINIPSTNTFGYFFSIYDSTAAITVYLNFKRAITYSPTIGDSVRVHGRIQFYTTGGGFGGGKRDSTGFAIISPDTIAAIGSGSNTVHNPLIIKRPNEKLESQLIELDSVQLVNNSDWTPPGGGFGGPQWVNIVVQHVNNKSLKDTLHVAAGFLSNNAPGLVFNVKGIGYQDDSTAPFLKHYYLMPRDYTDFITIVSQPINLHNIKDINQEAANGIADSSGLKVSIKGVVQSTNLYVPEIVTGGRFGLGYSAANGILFSVFDKTGSITIYDSAGNLGYTPAIGDSIFVHGLLHQKSRYSAGAGRRGGMMNTGWVVIGPDSLALPSNSQYNKIPAPIITKSFNDSLESKLIKITGVHLVNPKQWDTTGTTLNFGGTKYYIPKYFFTVDLIDKSGNTTRATIRNIDSLYYIPRPSGILNITGIEAQDTLYSANSAFSIWPRFVKDIEISYATYHIADVEKNNINLVDTLAGTLGYFQGTVHSENLDKTGLHFNLIDSTGAITVLGASTLGYTPARGDNLKVFGTVQQVNGLTIIVPDSIKVTNTGRPLFKPDVVSLLSELEESYLVTLKHVKLMFPKQWKPAGNGFSVTVQDTIYAADTFTVFISSGTTAFNMKQPATWFDVTGVVQQNYPFSPYKYGYYLEPRDSNDFALAGKTGIEGQSQNQIPVTLFPNPANNTLHVQIGDLKGEQAYLKIYAVTGQLIMEDKISNSSAINTADLPQGMYILRLNTPSGLQSAKTFLKQ